jgi:hypothetical protein
MSDRTAAALFKDIFEMLAQWPAGPMRDDLARRLWKMQRDYDFSPDQMGCDDALAALDLARRGIDPDWPDDGEVWLYGPEERGMRADDVINGSVDR